MSTRDPQDPQDLRSLADDPGFMDSLAELDEGLGGSSDRDTRRAGHSAPKPRTRPSTQPVPAAPSVPAAASAALPSVVVSPGRRPLLDLFPSAPQNRAAPAPLAPPASSIAPPRVVPKPRVGSPERAPGPATYETFYGLHERPFSLSSDPKFLYQSTEYDRVAQQMLGAIGRRQPLVLLTGEIGVGKTTLCRALVEQLDRRTLTSVVAGPIATVEELLRTLLLDFGVVSKDDAGRKRLESATQGELASALREFLDSLAPLQAFAVVIVDEAQTLPASVLRDLPPFVSADQARSLQFILAGQPALGSMVDRTQDLARAVSLRCTLGPLADDEVAGYVMHRLRIAGGSLRVDFDDEAFERLYVLSGGKPRLVNLLCDRALGAGFAASASTITSAMIDSAAEDLDMAPPASAISIFGNMRMLGALVMLMLAGAAAGVLTFHSDVAALIGRLGH